MKASQPIVKFYKKNENKYWWRLRNLSDRSYKTIPEVQKSVVDV